MEPSDQEFTINEVAAEILRIKRQSPALSISVLSNVIAIKVIEKLAALGWSPRLGIDDLIAVDRHSEFMADVWKVPVWFARHHIHVDIENDRLRAVLKRFAPLPLTDGDVWTLRVDSRDGGKGVYVVTDDVREAIAALAVEGSEARADNSSAVGTNRADLKGGE